MKIILDRVVPTQATVVERTSRETQSTDPRTSIGTFPKTYRRASAVWRKRCQISQPRLQLISLPRSTRTRIRSCHSRSSTTCTRGHASAVWVSSTGIYSLRGSKGRRYRGIIRNTCWPLLTLISAKCSRSCKKVEWSSSIQTSSPI